MAGESPCKSLYCTVLYCLQGQQIVSGNHCRTVIYDCGVGEEGGGGEGAMEYDGRLILIFA
jgi:hypothetical protein